MSSTWSRLNRSAEAGSDVIELPAGEVAGWNPGDQVAIAPSGYDAMNSEIRTILSVNGGNIF